MTAVSDVIKLKKKITLQNLEKVWDWKNYVDESDIPLNRMPKRQLATVYRLSINYYIVKSINV